MLNKLRGFLNVPFKLHVKSGTSSPLLSRKKKITALLLASLNENSYDRRTKWNGSLYSIVLAGSNSSVLQSNDLGTTNSGENVVKAATLSSFSHSLWQLVSIRKPAIDFNPFFSYNIEDYLILNFNIQCKAPVQLASRLGVM